jgi:hypothetical protein
MTPHSGKSRLIGAVWLLALSPNLALAAPPAPAIGRADLLKALSACRAIADSGERLACFDRTAASLDQAQASGDVIVVDRQQVKQIKRQAFGFTMPSLAIFDIGGHKDKDKDKNRDKDAGDESITATATSVHQTPDGKWVITLDDGAVWRQIDSDTLAMDPRAGSKIHIRRASLGSFLMNVDGQSGIRVHRDQ